MRLKLLLLYLLLMSVLPVAAEAEVDSCPYTDGAYYRSDVILIYNYRSNIFGLYDARSGDLIQVIDTFETNEFHVMAWKHDCHDVLVGTDDKVIIWDMTTLQRRAEAEIAGGKSKYSTVWDETGNYVVLSSGYLWSISSGAVFELKAQCLPDAHEWYFDYERHQILGIGKCRSYYDSDKAVSVFSLDTGEQLVRYESDEKWSAHRFRYRLTSYPTYLLIACDWLNSTDVIVYNRDTMQRVFTLPTSITLDVSYRHDISPDGRFIVGGRRQIRVWEVTQLMADSNAAPVLEFDGPRGFVTYLRFLDATTLQTENDFGDTDRWNILTGEQLP